MTVLRHFLTAAIVLGATSTIKEAKADGLGLSTFFTGSRSTDAETADSGSTVARKDHTLRMIAAGESGETIGARGAAISAENCSKIKQSAAAAKATTVQRHAPPSPVLTIRDTTCFAGIIATKIPQTGIGFIDGLVSQLVKIVSEGLCRSTNGFWSKISAAATSGNLSDLLGPAITQGTQYVTQRLDQLVPTSERQMPTIESLTPAADDTPSTIIPQIPVPAGGWGEAGYTMCGDTALISDEVTGTLSGTGQSRTYSQQMMSRGMGYSLKFTTGPEEYSPEVGPNISPFLGRITAQTVGPHAGITQGFAISTQTCDFAGNVSPVKTGIQPTILYLVTNSTDLPSNVVGLRPNTTYFLNYRNSDGREFTCPVGASCPFTVSFDKSEP